MRTEMLTELGQEIKIHLEQTGWSQRKLASKAGLAHSAISKIMRGKTNPTPETLNSIAQVLNIDPVYLMRLSGIPKPNTTRTPSVEYVAQRLDGLPNIVQSAVISGINAQLDAVEKVYKEAKKEADAENSTHLQRNGQRLDQRLDEEIIQTMPPVARDVLRQVRQHDQNAYEELMTYLSRVLHEANAAEARHREAALS